MKTLDKDVKEYFSCQLSDIHFTDQMLSQVEFDDCVLSNCDFSDTTFHNCKFIDCQFEQCNLTLVKFDYSRLSDVTFNDSKMIGIDWTKADWPTLLPFSPVHFHRCLMSDASFFGLPFKELTLDECKAHNADFRDGDFSNSNFSYSDFTGSLFHHTNLSSVNFTEASNYTIDIQSNTIKHAIFTRYEAVRLLESLDIKLVD